MVLASNCAASICVLMTPTKAMVSRAPVSRPACHLRRRLATCSGRQNPAAATRSGASQVSTSSRPPALARQARSGARYGCLGRVAMAGGSRSATADRIRSFSCRQGSLTLAGSVVARAATSWSRNGKRPSTELPISMRSPWLLSR